jgi:hypothetical protein
MTARRGILTKRTQFAQRTNQTRFGLPETDQAPGLLAERTQPGSDFSRKHFCEEADVEVISRLFPSDVADCIASKDMYDGELFQEEAELISASRPKRRTEFTGHDD